MFTREIDSWTADEVQFAADEGDLERDLSSFHVQIAPLAEPFNAANRRYDKVADGLSDTDHDAALDRVTCRNASRLFHHFRNHADLTPFQKKKIYDRVRMGKPVHRWLAEDLIRIADEGPHDVPFEDLLCDDEGPHDVPSENVPFEDYCEVV